MGGRVGGSIKVFFEKRPAIDVSPLLLASCRAILLVSSGSDRFTAPDKLGCSGKKGYSLVHHPNPSPQD